MKSRLGGYKGGHWPASTYIQSKGWIDVDLDFTIYNKKLASQTIEIKYQEM